MIASQSFFSRYLVAIHAASWTAIFALSVLGGNFLDWPPPFSVPLAVYFILVAFPFIIIPSFRAPALDISSPALLRKVIRFSPWGLTNLWALALFVLIMCIIGDVRVKSIRKGTDQTPQKSVRPVPVPSPNALGPRVVLCCSSGGAGF